MEAACVWACTRISVDGMGSLESFFSFLVPVGSDMRLWLLAFISSLKGVQIPGW